MNAAGGGESGILIKTLEGAAGTGQNHCILGQIMAWLPQITGVPAELTWLSTDSSMTKGRWGSLSCHAHYGGRWGGLSCHAQKH